jgi:hypothetical protein
VQRGRQFGKVVNLRDECFRQLMDIPVAPFSIWKLARSCKGADKASSGCQETDEARAHYVRIRPKIERMDTEELVKERPGKWKRDDVAAEKGELAACDGRPVTTYCGLDHRRREINASDASLIRLLQCKCQATPSTKANFKDPIGRLKVKQSNGPLRLGCMLAKHLSAMNRPIRPVG